MSWAEIKKSVNSNISKPINEQMREWAFGQSWLFTESSAFVPVKTGLYRIICVGSGCESSSINNGDTSNPKILTLSGGAGGVAIKTMRLNSGTSYSVSLNAAKVSVNSGWSEYKTDAVFNNMVKAYGSTPYKVNTSGKVTSVSTGGTAEGGDFNYTGESGKEVSHVSNVRGASVGVYICGLSGREMVSAYESEKMQTLVSGMGICGFGFGGGVSAYSARTEAILQVSGAACVIVQPIEMEE